VNIHATCVVLQNFGVLLLGKSGAGKSDLALRLIADRGARLVADDRVDITAKDGKIQASAPQILQGLLEVRGVGIIKTDFVPSAEIKLVVELVSSSTDIERMPEPSFYQIQDMSIPKICLNPFEISATAKILAALSLL
jgi:serine kinase of HPr protein (carbohydrate metabolism regulator)